MNKRPSIYIGKDLEAQIIALKGSHDDKVSAVINSIADRYAFTVQQSMPKLTEGEWLALMDCLNGYLTDDVAIAAQGLHWNLADAMEIKEFGEQWGLNPDFALRVKEMTVAEKIAILDVRDRFWAPGTETVANWTEKLLSCGAKIKDE